MHKYLILFLLFATPALGQYNVQTLNSTPSMSLQTKHNYQTYFNITLVGNVTSNQIDNAPAGAKIDFNICQDATGGRTWVWPNTFQNTSSITITATTLACTQASFITPDGTNWNNAGAGSGGGLTSVSSLPATCTPGVTASIQLTVSPFQIYYCSATNTWTIVGAGVSNPTNAAAPAVGWFLGNFCPTANTGQCVFSPANVQVDNTATWSNASTTLTTTDSPFTAADVTATQKQIWGTGTNQSNHSGCNPYDANSAKSLMTTTHMTITTFTDANHVVLSATPGTTFSSANQGCIVWGNTDDAGAAALWTLINVGNIPCPRVTMLGGYYLFTTPPSFMTTQPAGCAKHPDVFLISSPNPYGNTALASGMDLEGRGIGATTIFIPPDFPQTGACTNGPGAPLSAVACFSVQPLARWHDLSINGGGAMTVGPASGTALITVGVGTLENFLCAGWANKAGVIGVLAQTLAQLRQINIGGCGGIGLDVGSTTGNIWTGSNVPTSRAYFVWIEDNIGTNLQVETGGNMSFHTLQLEGTQDTSGGGISEIINNGGTLWIDDMDATQLTNDNGTVPGVTPYNCSANNGGGPCVLHCTHCRMGLSSVATLTRGIYITAGKVSTVFLQDSILFGGGGGFSYTDNGSSAANTLNDEGGNQFTGSGSSITGTGFKAVAVGAGLNSAAFTSAATNVGTTLAAQTVLASAFYPYNLEMKVTARQTLAGVGCGAGTNTVTVIAAWTTGGLAQTATFTNLLSFSANGAVGTTGFQLQAIRPDTGTAVTFTTTTTLASAGCSTTPQYVVDATI